MTNQISSMLSYEIDSETSVLLDEIYNDYQPDSVLFFRTGWGKWYARVQTSLPDDCQYSWHHVQSFAYKMLDQLHSKVQAK